MTALYCTYNIHQLQCIDAYNGIDMYTLTSLQKIPKLYFKAKYHNNVVQYNMISNMQ